MELDIARPGTSSRIHPEECVSIAPPQGMVIRSVDELQNGGVNVGDIKKLKEAGVCTLKRLEMVTRKELCNIKGISEAKVEKILEALAKIQQTGWITGTECKLQRDQVIRITTGCKEFDKLLGGGIETGSITELIGEFRTGKTQLCHTLAVTAQMPFAMGGGNGKVAIIDTEGGFRPEKIPPIAERFGLDGDAVLENIIYARALTHETQIDLLPTVAAKMAEDQFRLLIVDSLTSVFRTDFSGRGELAERQQKLNRFMSSLIKIGQEFGVAVVVTNQVISDPGGGMTFVPDPKKPVGGHVVAHASTTRLMFRKGKGSQRIVKVYGSPLLAEVECTFELDTSGIIDAKD